MIIQRLFESRPAAQTGTRRATAVDQKHSSSDNEDGSTRQADHPDSSEDEAPAEESEDESPAGASEHECGVTAGGYVAVNECTRDDNYGSATVGTSA